MPQDSFSCIYNYYSAYPLQMQGGLDPDGRDEGMPQRSVKQILAMTSVEI
jgi:hypothetical protein